MSYEIEKNVLAEFYAYHVEYTLTPVRIHNALHAHNLPIYDELFAELQ